jgi:hypothetical protein
MGLIRPLLAIAIFVSAAGCTNSSESGSGVSSTITSECAHVYAIHGVEPSVAIAAEVGTEYMKLYPS